MLFSISSPKIPKYDIFGLKFKDFYFCTKLCNKSNSRALTSNMTILFQNCYPKHPNKAFLVPNLKIYIFMKRFFYFLQKCCPKHPDNLFLIPNLRTYFCTKLCNTTNSRALISNMTIFFKKSCPKHPNKTFLVLNLRIFTFA